MAVWGLTPLQDQQLGGVLMWVPGGFAFGGAALARMAEWLRAGEQRVERHGRWRAGAPLLLLLLLCGSSGSLGQDILDPPPARIDARTRDVVHSFWMPNIAGKIDMVPGRTNRILVRADEPGVHHGQCAEFCGVQHANWLS